MRIVITMVVLLLPFIPHIACVTVRVDRKYSLAYVVRHVSEEEC